MRPSRRRRSRARPRPPTRATTSWAFRWEEQRDEQEAELAQIAETAPDARPPSTGRRSRSRQLLGR